MQHLIGGKLGVDRFAVGVEIVIADPSKQLICSLSRLVGLCGGEIHSGLTALGRKRLCCLKESFTHARAPCIRNDVKIVKRIDRACFYRAEGWVELAKADDALGLV